MGTERVRVLPPLRFYRSPIVQGLALFMVLVGWGHTTWTWAWMLGCYVFTLVGATAAYATEQFGSTPLPWETTDDVCLETMAANERMGAALAYIYREAPEWKVRVAVYLADYPFEWQQDEEEAQ